MKSPVRDALDRAIEKIGGISETARVADVSRQAVQQWTRVPEDKVPVISKASGIPKHELRPDVFPNNAAA